MNLVYNIDFKTAFCRRIVDFFLECAYIINTGIGCSVYFNNIYCSAFGDCLAHGTGVTGLIRPFVAEAVDCLGQYA